MKSDTVGPVCTQTSDTATTCITTTTTTTYEHDWIDVVYASTQIASTLFLIVVALALVAAIVRKS